MPVEGLARRWVVLGRVTKHVMQWLRCDSRFSVLTSLLLVASAYAQTNFAPEIGFTRIQHGWTNYSTAFLATQDSTSGDFGTVASFYTPLCDVTPCEYAAIFVWNGTPNQQVNFGAFSFQVFFWSGLAAFTNSPQAGDVASFTLAQPTGGSTSVPDAYTRGGRPAWLFRFTVTNAHVVLTNHHTYLIGVAARADSSRFGDLFVPTSSFAGVSDLQAGNTIIGGWQQIVDAGGATVYWGQLATELIVLTVTTPPQLAVEWHEGDVQLSWPGSAGCFKIESTPELRSVSDWSVLDIQPRFFDGTNWLTLSVADGTQWFRLRK